MNRTLAMLAAAGLIAATAAQAQNAPPPGNVNPGSMQSGAEQTGAPNQPRSQNTGAIKGTTGSGISAPEPRTGTDRDGINANVKPSSPNADVPSGAAAPKPRGTE
ncbi:MAG: hypothetical protein AB7V13_03710 [Pseudorhodoplanes sp.]|uniref:hypothetical protein n=1 Tax=Pseudorhodoplanes sp. TaxID=1934341 RepID=UPI003D11C6F0